MNLVKLKLEEFSLFICCCFFMKTSVEDIPPSPSQYCLPRRKGPASPRCSGNPAPSVPIVCWGCKPHPYCYVPLVFYPFYFTSFWVVERIANLGMLTKTSNSEQLRKPPSLSTLLVRNGWLSPQQCRCLWWVCSTCLFFLKGNSICPTYSLKLSTNRDQRLYWKTKRNQKCQN